MYSVGTYVHLVTAFEKFSMNENMCRVFGLLVCFENLFEMKINTLSFLIKYPGTS